MAHSPWPPGRPVDTRRCAGRCGRPACRSPTPAVRRSVGEKKKRQKKTKRATTRDADPVRIRGHAQRAKQGRNKDNKEEGEERRTYFSSRYFLSRVRCEVQQEAVSFSTVSGPLRAIRTSKVENTPPRENRESKSAVDKPRYANCGRDRRQYYRPTNSNVTATQASASQPSSTNPGT